jgi:hypothetical protein
MRRLGFISISILAVSLAAAPARAIAPHRIVALTGQDAPGTGANPADFLSFADLPGDEGPVINNQGQVAFSGRLIPRVSAITGPVVSDLNDRGIWSEAPGSLALVVREGMMAGNTGAIFGNGLREPVLNDAGRVAFQANLNRNLDDRSIWSGGPGNLSLVARTGENAPPSSDMSVSFLAIDDPRLNSTGHVAFRSTLSGPGVDPASGLNDRGLWNHSPADSTLRLLTRAGQLAPVEVVPVGDTTRFTEFSNPVLSDSGASAFRGTLAGPDVTNVNARGIWVETALGNFKLIAREGAPAPGTTDVFAAMGLPSINANGQVAFAAALADPGGARSGAGVWRSGGVGQMGTLQLLAQSGDPIDALIGPINPAAVNHAAIDIAQIDDGTVLGGFHQPVINNRGQVAFTAGLAGPAVTPQNDLGVFVTTNAGVKLVAREGSTVKGLPLGVTLAQCDNMDHFTPTMNARGQVAFMACLASPDAGTIFGKGIFATDLYGRVSLVARTGEEIEVRPGVLWSITDLRLRTGSGGGDGLGRSFNNRSHLAYWAALSPADGPASVYGEGIIESTTSTSGLGDVNGDGLVDRWDLALLSDWWGSWDFPQGDFDLDGAVTVNDLGIMQANFGDGFPEGSPSPNFVPEPSTLVLLLAALLTLAARSARTYHRTQTVRRLHPELTNECL